MLLKQASVQNNHSLRAALRKSLIVRMINDDGAVIKITRYTYETHAGGFRNRCCDFSRRLRMIFQAFA